MKLVDRILQRWRIRKASPFIRRGDRLLDVGCFDTSLIDAVRPRIASAAGIDPLAEPVTRDGITIHRGAIPGTHPFGPGEFDAITMLAVLEHIQDTDGLARECFRLLSPRGRVIITVPSPGVDHILAVLRFFRLIHGMSLEEHHGYDIRQTPGLFARAGFRLHRRASFQLGLNHLFVFEKPAEGSSEIAAA